MAHRPIIAGPVSGRGFPIGLLGIQRIALQHRHRRNEFALWIHCDGGPVAVKTLAAAFTPVAHFGVMDRHDAVPAYPWLEAYTCRRPDHILVQQLAQELGGRQQAVRIGHNLGQESLPGRGLIPGDLRGSLETGRQVPGIALPLGQGGRLTLSGTRASLRSSWQMPSASRLQVSYTAPRPRMGVEASSKLRRKRSRICPCSTSCARKCCSVLWAKDRTSIPSATFQLRPTVARRCASVSLTRVMRLQQQGCGQQARRYTATSIIPAVEGREVLIPKQLPPLPGQPAVETVAANQIQVQMVRFKQAALFCSLAQHAVPSAVAWLTVRL